MEPRIPPGHIRPTVICIIFRDANLAMGDISPDSNREIFVFEAHNKQKDQTYYRPLGGGVEFGEYSAQALRREFREEVNSELLNVRYWHTLENIFNLEGEWGHEVDFVYVGELADKSIYDKPFIYGKEDNGQLFKALWKSIADFADGRTPLYPDGLLELLTHPDANFPKVGTAPIEP
jgi:8-oxo-dGTP pyrophosphatase MutT (NUDIX family)